MVTKFPARLRRPTGVERTAGGASCAEAPQPLRSLAPPFNKRADGVSSVPPPMSAFPGPNPRKTPQLGSEEAPPAQVRRANGPMMTRPRQIFSEPCPPRCRPQAARPLVAGHVYQRRRPHLLLDGRTPPAPGRRQEDQPHDGSGPGPLRSTAGACTGRSAPRARGGGLSRPRPRRATAHSRCQDPHRGRPRSHHRRRPPARRKYAHRPGRRPPWGCRSPAAGPGTGSTHVT